MGRQHPSEGSHDDPAFIDPDGLEDVPRSTSWSNDETEELDDLHYGPTTTTDSALDGGPLVPKDPYLFIEILLGKNRKFRSKGWGHFKLSFGVKSRKVDMSREEFAEWRTRPNRRIIFVPDTGNEMSQSPLLTEETEFETLLDFVIETEENAADPIILPEWQRLGRLFNRGKKDDTAIKNPSKPMSKKEAAAMIGVSVKQLNGLISRRKLHCKELTRQTFVFCYDTLLKLGASETPPR